MHASLCSQCELGPSLEPKWLGAEPMELTEPTEPTEPTELTELTEPTESMEPMEPTGWSMDGAHQ